jgi:uncharacterized membrane protein required for colicin V production
MKFSWVDAVMIGIMAWGLFSTKKSDIITGTIIACHYYMGVFDVLGNVFSKDKIVEVVSFYLVILLAFLFFSFLRVGWKTILHFEGFYFFNSKITFVLSFIRHILFCSLILLGIMISAQSVLVTGAIESFSGKYLKKVAPAIYRCAYNNVIGKIIPGEPVNFIIFKLMAEQPPEQTKPPKELEQYNVVVYQVSE